MNECNEQWMIVTINTIYPFKVCLFFLGFADYESELNIQKLKMAYPIWQTKIRKVTWLGGNFAHDSFWDHWLRMQAQHSEIENSLMQYGGPLLDWAKICFSGAFEVKQFFVLLTGVRICWELSLTFWKHYSEFLYFDFSFVINSLQNPSVPSFVQSRNFFAFWSVTLDPPF